MSSYLENDVWEVSLSVEERQRINQQGRIQKNGYSIGKNTITEKSTMNLKKDNSDYVKYCKQRKNLSRNEILNRMISHLRTTYHDNLLYL